MEEGKMPMKLKFALNHNGRPIRTLDELREHCDIDQLLKDHRDGKLRRWLEAFKNFDDLISAIDDISAQDDLELAEKLVIILDIYRQILEEYRAKKEGFPKFFASGNLHYNLKEYQKAIADYTKALEIDPNVPNAHNNRESLYKIL
jgi:tetratricopeptide (TPR) repeat protein